ncbi:MAG: NAD(P)-dependent oxidoreductase [Spirochaetes bacterium]|nr:NAD(P)-dependent oxidoreductase [Spirochaetota bacterium]
MSAEIGWIGTGVMGKSMCMHILKKGYRVFVYNRTEEKAGELIKKGAEWCNSPEAVAAKSRYVFTIVGYPYDVREVMFGDRGVFKSVSAGSVLIDMTTSEPSLAEEIYGKARALGASSLDAPVSGGDVGAREAKLAIMAGGDRKSFDEVLPLFKLMGENISYMGGAGAGQHTKMSNQILISTSMIGVVESLLYAQKAGLDQREMLDIVGRGAAASWSFNNYGPRIIKGDYNPGFFIKHFIKDMGIALDEAKKMNLSLPGLALANQFYIAASAMGLENAGTQALYKVLEKLNS